jgi:hypothetical protein
MLLEIMPRLWLWAPRADTPVKRDPNRLMAVSYEQAIGTGR